jgi:hypothetical protein
MDGCFELGQGFCELVAAHKHEFIVSTMQVLFGEMALGAAENN